MLTRVALCLCIACVPLTAAADNLVSAWSFEEFDAGTFTEGLGWETEPDGPVTVVDDLPAPEGRKFVLLNSGGQPGGIQKVVETPRGRYRLSYYVSADPRGDLGVKSLTVLVGKPMGPRSVQDGRTFPHSVDTGSFTAGRMVWTQWSREMDLKGPTTLVAISSETPGEYGPCVDAVSLVMVERRRISVAASLGAFLPTSSATRDRFEDRWFRASLTTFDPVKPTHWRLIGEGGYYKLDGPTKARLRSFTVGLERGIGNKPSRQPYVVVRAGPYFANVEEVLTGFEESHTGLNLNASCGILFNRRIYLEARYDYFSRFAGFNFDGLSLSLGVRLFDIPM